MPMKFFRCLMGACLVGLIAACGGGVGSVPGAGAGAGAGGGGGGGGGSGGSSVSSGAPDTPQPPAATVLCSKSIDHALQTGDTEGLTDASAVARCVQQLGKSLSAGQESLSSALYGSESSEYAPGHDSQFVFPMSVEHAQPFIVGDKGKVFASVSTKDGGRSAGYGANILQQFKDSTNLGHLPAFKRLLSWLLAGDATKPLPASIRVNYSAIDATHVKEGFKRAGLEVVATACDIAVAGNCGGDSQLLVLGAQIKDDPLLEARVAQVVASGQPVLFVHTMAWGEHKASSQMLAGMGMLLGGYTGNYYELDAVARGRTAQANLLALSQFADVLPLLRRIVENDWRTDYDWRACEANDCSKVPALTSEVLAPAERFRRYIDALNRSGRNLFEQPSTDFVRLLAIWADAARQGIRYPMRKETQTGPFMQAVLADSLVAYVRPKGSAQTDLGTFMSAAEATRSDVSIVDEELTIALPQASGFTALGRFAVPGKTVAVQVLDAAGATLSLQLNTLDPNSTRLWAERYDRPRFVRSPEIALGVQPVTYVTSPYGGTLQLVFSGASAGAKVRLRVRGVARHPFLDLTAGGKLADFLTSFNATKFGWAEIRMPGFEIHTLASRMKEALNDAVYKGDLDRYLAELRTYVFEDAYQLAGFAIPGKSLPAAILNNCATWGWDCTDENLHRLPGTQHFNVDLYARCGYGCAGNPVDVSWVFHPRGWGESHELGHNLQQNLLNVHGDRSGEVSNNLFPLHKNWRLWRDFGVDLESDRIGYRSAFDMIVAARTEANPVQGAYDRLWGRPEYAMHNGERMAFYIQWVHYWAERTGDKASGWDILTQLYLHQRLFAKADWNSYKARLGYGNYANRPDGISGNDNLLIALSWMTRRDQRPTFDLWGVKYSAEAAAQVGSYGFEKEAALFYANDNTNNHATAVRIDMTSLKPTWPFK